MQEKLPYVSILVLNYNGRRWLFSCLSSLLKTEYPQYEIILVDNASTDGSVEFVKKNFPRVKIIKFSQNLGYALAYNIAYKYAKGDILVFLNNDTMVSSNWLKEIIKFLSKVRTPIIVGPKICKMYNKRKLDSAGGVVNILGFTWSRGYLDDADDPKYNKIYEPFYVSGAALIIPKQLFEELGCFDASYFMYCEELDLCWRARLRGYKIIYFPRSIIYHYGSPSLKKYSVRYYYLNTRNMIVTMIKCLERKNLIPMLTAYLFLSFLLGFILTIKKRKNFVKAYIEAISWIIQNISNILFKRKSIQAQRVIPDNRIFVFFSKSFGFRKFRRILKS